MDAIDRYDINDYVVHDQELLLSDSPLAAPLYAAQAKLHRLQQNFLAVSASVRSDLMRAEEKVASRGTTTNSLGVLQARGSEIDRLCGEIDVAAELTVALLVAYREA